MPSYTFIADNESAVPQGYCQRVGIATRQNQNWQDPTDGRVKGPDVWAFRMIQKSGIPLLPGTVYRPYMTDQAIPQQDSILFMQLAQPAVQQVQVNAPFAEPVSGNRGQDVIPLPVVGDKTRYAPAGDLEPLPDAALAGGGDGLYAEMDGLAGTYSDIESSGREILRPRDLRIPQSTPTQQRGG